MGFIKDVKAQTMSTHAQRALQEGRRVFVCRINHGMSAVGTSGPLSGVAEQIEAIEALGWRMDRCSFDHSSGRNVSAYLIFRRGV